jgi:ribosomal-protein-alanine acetyltransferase
VTGPVIGSATGPVTGDAFQLRPMGPADIDDVHRLEVACSPDPWSRDLLAAELDDRGPDRHWLVATEGGADGDRSSAIVGFGGILSVVDEAHVMNMGVHPQRRRRGLARRLLAALLIRAVDDGATSATLEVRASNRAAADLYRGFGFRASGRRPRYYANGEDAEIMWCHGLARADRLARFRHLAGEGRRLWPS